MRAEAGGNGNVLAAVDRVADRAAAGAGAGTAVVMAGEASTASFPVGTEVTARFASPVTITIER